MGKYFGTDGFRGEANRTLTVQHAFEIGRFIGWYFGKEHKCKVVIGKDTRRSCYMFEDALSAGLTASGADVYLLHVTTTPSVSYAVQTEDFDCGIMITASHNPYTDNGIKLVNSRGEKMEQDVLDKIEAHLDGLLPPSPGDLREDRADDRLYRRPQPLCRLPHFARDQLLQEHPRRPRLRQRQHLDDCQKRVRRARRENLCHQQRAERPEYQRRQRLDPY